MTRPDGTAGVGAYNAGMNAAVISKQGSPVAPNVNLIDDWPDPSAGAGEVVVRTEAAAMNHLDLWVGRGLPGLDLDYPRISGSDGVGVVTAVGAGVDDAWLGRRIVLNAAVPVPDRIHPGGAPPPRDIRMIGEHVHGCQAEYFVAPVTNVLDVDDADPVEAAAFALVHLTAYRMLKTRAGLTPGQRVLITGIGGGVALACLNIALHFGCETIVTSRHQWKLDRARELGAHYGVLDDGEDWSRDVRAVTGKRGVDICADSIGRAVHMSCIKSMARGGTLVTCGCTTGHAPETDLARIFWNQLRIVGSTMGSMDEFREIIALFRAGAMSPVIDRVVEASDAPSAYEHLESGEQFGKIVVRWSS